MFSVTDTGIKELEDNANGFITNSEQENSTHYFYLSRWEVVDAGQREL